MVVDVSVTRGLGGRLSLVWRKLEADVCVQTGRRRDEGIGR